MMAVERERFAATEVAVVLSHYDIGVIETAREFPRGSRSSPKLLLQSATGTYLLKRRAPGRDDPRRVEFAHALTEHLRARRFPAPQALMRRDGGGPYVEHNDRVYELFEFVRGERYDESLESTLRAGKALARFHTATADFRSEWWPPPVTFHDAVAVRTGLHNVPSATASHDSVAGREGELLSIVQELLERYEEAAGRATALGVETMPRGVIHGDWHPGNLLFERQRVAAVLDLDAARNAPRVIDAANGVLQFSVLRGPGDPERWPAYFDETRMRRFLIGYRAARELSEDEVRVTPWLMLESLIAESVVPIALTGSFGPLPGFGVLQMVRRKARWLSPATLQSIEQLLLQ